MRSEKFTGSFIDPNNRNAVEKWARGMCRGLDLNETAKELGTIAEPRSVAEALIGNNSDDPTIRSAAVRVCEAELKRSDA